MINEQFKNREKINMLIISYSNLVIGMQVHDDEGNIGTVKEYEETINSLRHDIITLKNNG